jgi:hypothetical protein
VVLGRLSDGIRLGSQEDLPAAFSLHIVERIALHAAPPS